MIDIPAVPVISKELELINAARGWPFENPNTVALIRAVNALRLLGKEQALATLEKYIELVDETDIIGNESNIVFWIIRVLFEPSRLDQQIPPPAIAVGAPDATLAEGARWPLNPLTIVGDIPFMVGSRMMMGGLPEHPKSHIQWARRHGILRDTPLEPSMDPWDAMKVVARDKRLTPLNEFNRADLETWLKIQAAGMTELAPNTMDNLFHAKKQLAKWQQRDNAPSRTSKEYRWDANKELFVERIH
jgi:hypothetical protein